MLIASLFLVEYCSQQWKPNRLLLSTGRQGRVLAFAGVDLLPLRALLAFDVAAPAHLTLARPGHLPALGVVATPAADGVTVLVLVALAGGRARRVLAGSAETRRVLNVKQVHGAGNLIVQAGQGLWRRLLLLMMVMMMVVMLAAARGDFSLAGCLVGGASHLDGRLVSLFQPRADLVEGQELPPAGLDGARARDAVAFAGGLHSTLDYLEQRQ